MCIDYTHLNKAYLKNSYPLSQIDQLVDPTSNHKLFNFIDTFLGWFQKTRSILSLSPIDGLSL